MRLCFIAMHTSVIVSFLLSKRSFLFNVFIHGGKWKLLSGKKTRGKKRVKIFVRAEKIRFAFGKTPD